MSAVYLSHLSHSLGGRRQSVHDAAARDQLLSPPAALVDAGFDTHHVCERDESAYSLAARAFTNSGIEAAGVDAIVYSTCVPQNGHDGNGAGFESSRDVKDLMRFPACRLQADFRMQDAFVIGLNQQACTGMLGALRIARSLVIAEPGIDNVLCITADRFPEGARYEQAYNLISDGAAACLVGRGATGFRLVDVHQLSNGGLMSASDDETAGSFFTYTCRLVDEILARNGMAMRDVDWVVPQNVNRTALTVLARLLDLDEALMFCPSVGETGHVISADNVINLDALLASGRLSAGDCVLTFMAGFGSHWQAALLEVA